MNIRKTKPLIICRRILATTTLALVSVASLPALAINQNTVLAELETVQANWAQSSITSELKNTGQDGISSVSLGNEVTIAVESSSSAHFILALVDSYGEVKIIRPEGPSTNAEYSFTAEAPVGQYSLFTFGTDTEVPADLLGLPAGQTVHSMEYKIDPLKKMIAGLSSYSQTNQLSTSPEYQFLIEDSTLALQTRGIMKKISRLDKRKQPATKKLNPTIVAKAEVVEPAKATITTPIPVAETVPVKAAITAEPVKAAKTERPKIKIIRGAGPDSLSLDIKFQLNSASLTTSGINSLDTLGSALVAMQRDGSLPSLLLEGHTDDSGEAKYNLNLSEERANSARAYLMERFDLPENSIDAIGLGESSPKTPNSDNSARQINRRVELKVVH